jgi:UTP--glucose-1-phosphate uridylyltransferase
VLSQEIFEPLSRAQRGVNGEIQLTDSLDYLARTKGMLAVEARTQMYDTGDKLGLLIANIELALRRPELASGLLSHLKKMQGDRR